MFHLPINKQESLQRGWEELDIIFVTGDAYIDHPAFGTALLARLLESAGLRVGIIAQPDWKNPDSFKVLGRPKLFFAVTAGAMDSMVAHYTPSPQDPPRRCLHSGQSPWCPPQQSHHSLYLLLQGGIQGRAGCDRRDRGESSPVCPF